MKEFLLLLRAGRPTNTKTKEELKLELDAWNQYMGMLAQSGKMVGGSPLAPGGAVVSLSGIVTEPVKAITEGIIGGYMLIKAMDMSEAKDLARQCPHITDGGNIEVREIAPMPAM